MGKNENLETVIEEVSVESLLQEQNKDIKQILFYKKVLLAINSVILVVVLGVCLVVGGKVNTILDETNTLLSSANTTVDIINEELESTDFDRIDIILENLEDVTDRLAKIANFFD